MFHRVPTHDPNYELFKSEFKTYEKTLKLLINTVKKNYYNNQFKKFSNDIKYTWRTIKDVLNRNRSNNKMQTEIYCQR